MKKVLAVAFATALSLILASQLFAKGATTKIVIEGATLQSLLKSRIEVLLQTSTFGRVQERLRRKRGSIRARRVSL